MAGFDWVEISTSRCMINHYKFVFTTRYLCEITAYPKFQQVWYLPICYLSTYYFSPSTPLYAVPLKQLLYFLLHPCLLQREIRHAICSCVCACHSLLSILDLFLKHASLKHIYPLILNLLSLITFYPPCCLRLCTDTS